jgi:predicted nuclease of predicted toxin-antitoxin system
VTRRRLALAVAVVAFLAVSALVARWLQADGAERAKVVRVLEAQARGDARAMATRLARRGDVEIVRYDSDTARSLGDARGPTRVVWRTAQSLTVVQCIEVQRSGSPADRRVTLLRLSGPIARTGSC